MLIIILLKVGHDYGVRDVGSLTQRYMRIEKFIPFWAEDLNSYTTPIEAGNTYRVKFDVRIFIFYVKCNINKFRLHMK